MQWLPLRLLLLVLLANAKHRNCCCHCSVTLAIASFIIVPTGLLSQTETGSQSVSLSVLRVRRLVALSDSLLAAVEHSVTCRGRWLSLNVSQSRRVAESQSLSLQLRSDPMRSDADARRQDT